MHIKVETTRKSCNSHLASRAQLHQLHKQFRKVNTCPQTLWQNTWNLTKIICWHTMQPTWKHATCTIWHLIAVTPGATWRANDSGKVALSSSRSRSSSSSSTWEVPGSTLCGFYPLQALTLLPGSQQWYPPIYPLLSHWDPSVISTPQCSSDVFIWSCYWLDILCDTVPSE